MNKLLIVLPSSFLIVFLACGSAMAAVTLPASATDTVTMLLFGCLLVGLAGIGKGKSSKK